VYLPFLAFECLSPVVKVQIAKATAQVLQQLQDSRVLYLA